MRATTTLLSVAIVFSGAVPAQQVPGEKPEVFMWVGAHRLWDDAPAVLEDMLRFARRHGIVPYASGMVGPERLDRFLSRCDERGIDDAWIEIGIPRELATGVTAEEFVGDAAAREPVLGRYRELGRVYAAHGHERVRVTLFDEAPLGAFRRAAGERTGYLEEWRAFREHGPGAFALLKRAFEEGCPEAEVGLFLHHPHNASPEMAGRFSGVAAFTARAAEHGGRPDFLFSDVYRGYFMRGYGYEATNDYVRDVAAHTRRVADRHGMRAYQLGQAHTIKLGYTPSRHEIDGNVRAMLEGGVHGLGWYWPNYAATDHTAPGEPAEVPVSHEPFVPNAWGRTGPAGSMYGTSRDRWVYAYMRALEATGRLEPDACFDLWVYGHDFDHGEHRVALRTRAGDWEALGALHPERGAEGYEEPARGDRVRAGRDRWRAVVFHALDRERFLHRADGRARVHLRITTPGTSDGSHLAAAYAVPCRPTRSFLTAGEVTTRIAERPRHVQVDALVRHVRPHAVPLEGGEPVVVMLDETTAAARPGPELTSPGHWRREGTGAVLEPWYEHGRDREHGAYFARLARDWTAEEGGSKYPGMVARHLFSASVGYLLSGEVRWLEHAKELHAWLMEHGHDEEHGLFFDEVDRRGRVVDGGKDLFMQLYALTGLAMYHTVTRDPEVLAVIGRSVDLLERHAWDAEHGGYVRALTRELEVADHAKAVSPQLAPVSGHLLYLHAATGEARWLRRAERISRVVLERMRDAEAGWVLEAFDRQWRLRARGDRSPRAVNTGHNAEIAWSALRLHRLTGEAGWREAGVAMGERVMERAFDAGPGFWAKGFEAEKPGTLARETPWWIQAYGNLLALNLYRETGELRYLEAFRRGAAFWDRHFVDREHGGAFLAVDAAGAVTRGDKAVRTKTSYHFDGACAAGGAVHGGLGHRAAGGAAFPRRGPPPRRPLAAGSGGRPGGAHRPGVGERGGLVRFR